MSQGVYRRGQRRHYGANGGESFHHLLPPMKAICITDEIDTCDCCGRTDFKATVVMQLSDGGILHYGRTCAARNSGKTSKQIKQEVFAEEARQRSRQATMAANAAALAAWEKDDFNVKALEVQRRNYHQTGGQQIHGNFPDWLRNRALGLSV